MNMPPPKPVLHEVLLQALLPLTVLLVNVVVPLL
jgi:hypothetical protein